MYSKRESSIQKLDLALSVASTEFNNLLILIEKYRCKTQRQLLLMRLDSQGDASNQLGKIFVQ